MKVFSRSTTVVVNDATSTPPAPLLQPSNRSSYHSNRFSYCALHCISFINTLQQFLSTVLSFVLHLAPPTQNQPSTHSAITQHQTKLYWRPSSKALRAYSNPPLSILLLDKGFYSTAYIFHLLISASSTLLQPFPQFSSTATTSYAFTLPQLDYFLQQCVTDSLTPAYFCISRSRSHFPFYTAHSLSQSFHLHLSPTTSIPRSSISAPALHSRSSRSTPSPRHRHQPNTCHWFWFTLWLGTVAPSLNWSSVLEFSVQCHSMRPHPQCPATDLLSSVLVCVLSRHDRILRPPMTFSFAGFYSLRGSIWCRHLSPFSHHLLFLLVAHIIDQYGCNPSEPSVTASRLPLPYPTKPLIASRP